MSETLRELLNDHKWHLADLSRLRVIVRHRGAPDDEREIEGSSVLAIGPEGIEVQADAGLDAERDLEDGKVFIPFHRILRVVGEGVLWQRKKE